MVPVMRVEGLAVHGAQEALPRPPARHEPVADREHDRRRQDHPRVRPVQHDGEEAWHGSDDPDRQSDDQTGHPDADVDDEEEEREQRPDPPVLFALHREDRLASRGLDGHPRRSSVRSAKRLFQP